MPQYMLALYDDPSGWKKLSPEEIQKTVEKYTTWSKRPYVIQGKRLAADLGRRVGLGVPHVDVWRTTSHPEDDDRRPPPERARRAGLGAQHVGQAQATQ